MTSFICLSLQVFLYIWRFTILGLKPPLGLGLLQFLINYHLEYYWASLNNPPLGLTRPLLGGSYLVAISPTLPLLNFLFPRLRTTVSSYSTRPFVCFCELASVASTYHMWSMLSLFRPLKLGAKWHITFVITERTARLSFLLWHIILELILFLFEICY